MSNLLSTHELKQIEIRGCLSKHKKSQYWQAILIYTDDNGNEVQKSRSTKQVKKTEAYHAMMRMIKEEEEFIKKPAPSTYFNGLSRILDQRNCWQKH